MPGEMKMVRGDLTLWLIALFLMASFSPVVGGTEGSYDLIKPLDMTAPDIEETMERVRDNTAFIENKGQIDPTDIKFYSNDGNVFFTPTGVMYRFREMEPIENEYDQNGPFGGKFREPPRSYHERGVVLKYTFVGANIVIPEGRDRCSWNNNYFKGNDPDQWFTEVPNYREVFYPEVWDGIDIVYRQKNGGIKYDIIVHPGADPDDIRIRIEGANGLSINQNGDLVIGTEYCDIIDSGLVTFYMDDHNVRVVCDFKLNDPYTFGFSLEQYDRSKVLVIDPLTYSTFIGGSGVDFGHAITLDSRGNAYITGQTYDSTIYYPTTVGAYDNAHNENFDVFVTKLNSDGSSLQYSTFLGGSGADHGYGIKVDTSGSAYITGTTSDSNIDFPITSGAFDTTQNQGLDIFVTKLNPAGSSLIYSTFIGGSANDHGYGIAIDSDGNAFITGFTHDSTIDYPTTDDAYDTTHNGDDDVFVSKLSSTGSFLIYSTLIGGPYGDVCYGIEVDSIGNAYITGVAPGSYPTTIGAYDSSFNGGCDVFVTKLNNLGSSLIYSTYIGGSTSDESYAIALDSSGNAYITGYTGSSDYPTNPGAYDLSYNENEDAFVTKLSFDGSNIIYSTFLGGSGADCGKGIAINPNGYAHITGFTVDAIIDYPTTSNAYETTHNGNYDVFLTQLNSTGSSLLYSTFLGGDGYDHGRSVVVDSNRKCYLTGYTDHSTINYPTTNGAYDTVHNGDYDVFISKIDLAIIPTAPLNLNGTIGNGFINLTWNRPIDDGSSSILNYTIYRGISIETISKFKVIQNITFFNDTFVQNGGTYFYFITANNSVGESNHSEIIRIYDDDPPNVTDLTPAIATTGDEFNITFNVVDNVLVEKVVLVMDDGFTNVTTYHKDFNSNGLCTFKYTAPTRIVDEVKYSVVATDPSGNAGGLNGSFRVIDNDPPELFADDTNYPITTGDLINFSFDIRDNMEVAWANLTCRVSNDTLWTMELMDGPDTFWYNTIVIGKNDEFDEGSAILLNGPPFNLTLTMCDIFGNMRTIELPERKLVDNDPPVLLEDLSDRNASTGEDFTFRFKAMDNTDLSHAEVEYWYMNGTRFRASLPRPLMGGVWETSFKVPVSPPFNEIVYWNRTEIECNLTYSFHIWDTSGNELVHNATAIKINDTIPPELVSCEYIPAAGPTTGDPFEIKVRFKDNIQVRFASILFKFFHDLEHSTSEYRAWMNRSTTEEGLFSVSFAEISDSEFRFFQYRIEVWDAGDHSPQFFNFPRLNIIDNDPPTIESCFSQRNTTTGGKFNVGVTVRDNWMVSDVRMDVWSTGEVKEYILKENTSISYWNEWDHPYHYEGVLDIPVDSVEPLHIILKVTDLSNNTASTPELIIVVIDNIAPSLQPISNITVKKGETLQIAAVATDNIGIDRVHWEGSPITASGLTLEGIINQAGTFIITVTVLDKAGNTNTTRFSLIVEGPDDDKDSSSMVIMIIVALVLLAVIAITIYRVWRSDREPFTGPEDGTASREPPKLDEGPEVPELPPSPEKEVVVVTVPATTPAPAQAYVPSDQIPSAPMPVRGEVGSYIPPPGKGSEPQPLVPRSAEEKRVLEQGHEPPKMLGKEPVDELGPKAQSLLKP